MASSRRERVSLFTMAIVAAMLSTGACERKDIMTRCMDQWRTLIASSSQQEEELNAQAFAKCARENRLVYRLSLKDPTSGAEVPFAEIGKQNGEIAVRLTVEGGDKEQGYDWKARSAQSIYPLLQE